MSQRCVLVIDDEYRLREVVRMTLEIAMGWRTLGAASGPAGLELARSQHPDAILLDLMMPGMDGFTTLRHLQADATTATIPVVLLTAKDSVSYGRDLAGTQVAACIPKPFNALGLAQQIADRLGWEQGN